MDGGAVSDVRSCAAMNSWSSWLCAVGDVSTKSDDELLFFPYPTTSAGEMHVANASSGHARASLQGAHPLISDEVVGCYGLSTEPIGSYSM